MGDAPIAAVRKLLIEDHGLSGAKVTPDARILHDLGVDGGDAGELFQALHERFGTDFTELATQWRTFFNTEGASPRAILFGILAIIVCGGVAGVTVAALQWPKFLGMALALTMFYGGSWLFSRWFGRDLQPLTVEGLAEIVRAGRWPVDPSNVR